MPNSNVELLTKVAKRLGPLLREVVFVGGCTTALLITDEAAAEVRPTFDVGRGLGFESPRAYHIFQSLR